MAYDISFILLVVELVLLVPTLLLIIQGTREERQRAKLLDHISDTAKMLSRQEYFHSVESAMRSAERAIKGSITGSPPKTAEQEESVRRIVGIIEQITNGRVKSDVSAVEIRYLVPKAQDRLTVAFRYISAGASVRFHPGLLVNDLRYVISDHKMTVLGLPTTPGENQATREGFSIPSEALTEILDREFESKWMNAVEYDAYSSEILSELKSHNPKVSSKLLSEQLLIPAEEIERILGSFAKTLDS